MSKKEAIIQAAIQTFKENGIEKTKISDIVKNAGVAQGTYYLYFPSKLSVMPAIAKVMVDKIMTMMKDMVEVNAPFSRKLEQLIDAIFLINRDYREIHALIYTGLASTEHLKEWESVYEPVYNWINELLETAKADGILRPSVNTKPASKLIIGLVESAAEQIYLYDNDKKEDEIALEQKEEVLQFLMHALSVQV